MALWRQLDHEISGDIAWICGVAWEDVKWPVAVRAGDSLRARAECLAKRPSATDPTRGVVELRYTLLNQRDETAWTCRSINLVEVGPATADHSSGAILISRPSRSSLKSTWQLRREVPAS